MALPSQERATDGVIDIWNLDSRTIYSVLPAGGAMLPSASARCAIIVLYLMTSGDAGIPAPSDLPGPGTRRETPANIQ